MDATSWISSLRRGGAALLALAALSAAALAFASQSHASDPLPRVQSDFKWTPAVPTVGQTVTFESMSQASGIGNSVTDYRWDLDGDTANSYETGWGSTPTITTSYPVRGTVLVRLQVEDTLGNRSTIRKSVTVSGQPPIVSFTFSPAAPRAGQPVLFTSTATDSDGTLGAQVWDLNGDGIYGNAAGPTAVRVFDAPGVYVVGLRVTDNEGAVSFLSQAVSVSPALSSGLRTQARLLSPFPVVRIAGRIGRGGARVRLLVIDAPRGSTVVVRCGGRGCPFRKQTRSASVRGPEAEVTRRVRVHRLERLLKPGVTLRISVTKPGTIGKYTIFKVRRHKAPSRTDLCLVPGSRRPLACPSA